EILAALDSEFDLGVDKMNAPSSNVVLAPMKDRVLKTSFGEVDIAAGSVAFVMEKQHAVTVYNFDDMHRDSVVIKIAGRSISLAPGMHATITSERVQSFESINPVYAIGYRNVRESIVSSSIKVYVSEFSIPSAVYVVRPIRQMINSPARQARR